MRSSPFGSVIAAQRKLLGKENEMKGVHYQAGRRGAARRRTRLGRTAGSDLRIHRHQRYCANTGRLQRRQMECIGGVPPTFSEGPTPYRFGTLTLTHKALKEHQAQLSDMTDPPTDDGRVVTFSIANLPGDLSEAAGSLSLPATAANCPSSYTGRRFQTIPPCSFIIRQKIPPADGYTLDLGPITKNHLSGLIDITDVQQHGYGCALQMQGHNNNWSGTRECIAAAGTLRSLHSFTAISTRVGGNVAQQ
jgi:hypothetical protein